VILNLFLWGKAVVYRDSLTRFLSSFNDVKQFMHGQFMRFLIYFHDGSFFTDLKGRPKSILYNSLNVLQMHGGYFASQLQVKSIWIIAKLWQTMQMYNTYTIHTERIMSLKYILSSEHL
jgi:hypothetical protein